MSKPTKNSLLIFIETVLGVKLNRHQRHIVQAVLQQRRVAIASCHSAGKTFVLACLAIAWTAIHPDARTIIVVPGWLMAKSVIFAEIHTLLERAKHQLPVVSSTLTEIRFGAKNVILGLSASDPGRLQGHHSGHLLVVVDEAPAVDVTFWPSIEGTLDGGDSRLVIAGNPVTLSGAFHDAFGRARASWHTIQISAFDTANFREVDLPALLAMSDEELDHNERPYLITRRWVRERFKEWFNGDISNSPLWASRVLGLFPSEGTNNLFPLTALEAARRPAADPGGNVIVGGVDVAGAGRDRTVAIAVAGGAILDVMVSTDSDARGPVLAFLKKHSARLSTVRIDSIGLGYYFCEHVRSAGYRVEPINVARSADDPERFANLKAQRYWFLRERFQAGGISGLSDALFEELAPIGYVIDPRGRTAIEDKAAVRSSIGRSPDLAEALMLAAGDHDAHIDLSFQNRAAELFASQTAGRQQGFDAVVDPGDRLYARQPDFSIAEDRAQAMAKYSHRKK